ncbi:MAG: hypothetical protein NTV01_17485 [Bacteroidia bacterium]|nr:hypothetical protein [Bacteroidia bacterium]
MKRLSLFLILALPLTPAALMAQEVISSGGTCVKVSGISLSWTVGEPVTETLSSGSLTLTQGFHQTRLSASTIDEIVTPGLKLLSFG